MDPVIKSGRYGRNSTNKLLYFYIVILVLCHPTQSFDLLSTLMSQGSSSLPNLKSIVSPEMLEKMKGLLPYSKGGGSNSNSQSPSQLGNGEVGQIEKLLAKLKPAEGRFDPAVLELLASMDQRQHQLSQSQTSNPKPNVPPQNQNRYSRYRNKKPTTPQTVSYHHAPIDTDTTEQDSQIELEHSTSPPASTTKAFQVEGKPKFSSKFRLPIHKNWKQTKNKQSDHPIENTSHSYDYVLDPNIRNHRLYELELEQGGQQHERFENYENFTALDQMEDLMAEESYDHHEAVVPPPPSTSPRPRLRTPTPQPGRPTTVQMKMPHAHANNGWVGKTRTRKPEVLPMPIPTPASSSSSYEELISFETETDEDMSSHDREPLQRASTEKTVIYSYPMNNAKSPGSGEPNYDSDKSYEMSTTNKFRPSPMDLSPPVYFEPDQDFYTSTLNNDNNKHRSKSSNQQHRRRKQQQQQQTQIMYQAGHGVDPDYLHSGDIDHTTPFQSHLDSMNFHAASQNRAEYVMPPIPNQNQNQQQQQPQEFQFQQNPHLNNPQFHQPTTQYPQNGNLNLNSPALGPFQPPQNSPHQNQKQDRILQGGPMHMPPMSQMYGHGHGHGPAHSHGYPQSSSGMYPETFKNVYAPAGSENVYHEVPIYPLVYPSHHQNQPQHSTNDLAYSAGQNYYHNQGWGHDQGHHQHPTESSWTSTFFILGGLVALSAMIAFFLPTFLASGTAGKTGGKDKGDDKISHNESDLWTEIKGLYTDIVSIAKGDYSTFHRNPHNQINSNDLPKIHISEDELEAEADAEAEAEAEADEGNATLSPDVMVKRIGEDGGGSDSESYSSEEDVPASTTAEELEAVQRTSELHASQTQTMPSSDYKIDKKKKKKPVNINDTFAFGLYNNEPVGTTSRDGLDFANAFNQTLRAWEKVPLISN